MKDLKWTKVESESTSFIECVSCRSITLDEGEHGYFVRYPGKEDILYTYERPCNMLGSLEEWYIEGSDIYIKHKGEPPARQHIGKISF
jgi:hypothetical protein